MILVALQLLKHDYRSFYPKWYHWLYLLLTIFVALFTYYFASKALGENLNPDVQWYSQTYFQYVILGELGLALPIAFLTTPARSMVLLINSNILPELIRRHWRDSALFLLKFSFGLFFKDFVYIFLVFIMANLFFSLQMSLGALLILFLFSFIGLPLFMGLGFCCSLFVMLTGRGRYIAATVAGYLSALGGVYFPLEVFGSELKKVLFYLNPQAQHLESLRQTLHAGSFEFLFSYSLYSLAGAVLLWASFLMIYPRAIAKLRRRGIPHLKFN